MIKALVPVAADLASSIALRCACQLAELTIVDIQTIHIKESSSDQSTMGTGWVRLTWERTMLTQAQDEIAQLIRAERTHCPTLGWPKMLFGDRDEEILRELRAGSYDLFLEGTIPTFSSSYLTKRLQSPLYQKMPCPFIMVKNLMPLNKASIILDKSVDAPRLIQAFTRVIAGAKLPLDVFYLMFKETGEKNAEEAETSLKTAVELLEQQGWTPERSEVLQGDPAELADQLEDYGLLATLLSRSLKTKSPLYKFLIRTPVPIFLSWR